VGDGVAVAEGIGVGARDCLAAGQAVRIIVGVGEGVGGSVGLELELGLGLGLWLGLPDMVGDGLGVGMYQQNDPEGVGDAATTPGRRVAPGASDSSPITTPDALALGSMVALGSTWPFQLSLGLPEAPGLCGKPLLLLSGVGRMIEPKAIPTTRMDARQASRKTVLRRCVRGAVRGWRTGLSIAVFDPGKCDPRLWPRAVPASSTASKPPPMAPVIGFRGRSWAARTIPSLEKSGAGLAGSSIASTAS
jgi:hypothetical protein